MNGIKLTSSWKKWIVCVLLIVLVARVVAMFVAPITDPSEGRYAHICATMSASGNYVEPQFIHDSGILEVFAGKPPLYFQGGALSCLIFGNISFSPRLPALFFAIFTLLIIFGAVKKLRDEPSAFSAIFLCGTGLIFYIFSGVCITDMPLVTAVTGALLFYALFLETSERKEKKLYSVLFFIFMALGMLSKGPVGVGFAGLPILLVTCYLNRWKDLKDHAWFTGIFLFLLITLPWYISMQMRHPDFFEYFFVNENFKRFIFKEYGDRYGAGREYFKGIAVLWFLLMNLTGVLLFVLAQFKKNLRAVFYTKTQLQKPLDLLMLFGFLSLTLFLALSSRVLLYYLLPTAPLFAVWLALRLREAAPWETYPRVTRFFVCAMGVILVCTSMGVGAIAWIKPESQTLHTYQKWVAHYPEFQNDSARLYFAGKTPYSANFYFQEKVRQHPAEGDFLSIRHSQNDYLLIRKSFVCDYHLDSYLPRPLLFEYDNIRIYGPQNKTSFQRSK